MSRNVEKEWSEDHAHAVCCVCDWTDSGRADDDRYVQRHALIHASETGHKVQYNATESWVATVSPAS